jgi:hypothetical protein
MAEIRDFMRLARLMLLSWHRENDFCGSKKMTNFSSIAGGALWAIVSILLVSAALEPVSVGSQIEMEIAQSAAADATA